MDNDNDNDDNGIISVVSNDVFNITNKRYYMIELLKQN